MRLARSGVEPMTAALPILGKPGRALAFEAPGRYVNPFELDAPELMEWIERKAPRAIGSWRELGAEEYARAFTAARTAGYNVVDDLYQGYIATLRRSDGNAKDFASTVLPTMRAKGWLPQLSDEQMGRRLQLIFDTNLRLSQASGRWDRIQRTKLALPYLLGTTARDDRVRHPPGSEEDHRAFEGILLPVDHPFWQSYFPPLGFRCRCQVVQRSRGQVARAGLEVTAEAELASRIARLGQPWGFLPGGNPLAGIEEAAEEANEHRLEGAPAISVQFERGRAQSAWASMAVQAAVQAVEALIAKLFG
jgi:hypothetical protein